LLGAAPPDLGCEVAYAGVRTVGEVTVACVLITIRRPLLTVGAGLITVRTRLIGVSVRLINI